MKRLKEWAKKLHRDSENEKDRRGKKNFKLFETLIREECRKIFGEFWIGVEGFHYCHTSGKSKVFGDERYEEKLHVTFNIDGVDFSIVVRPISSTDDSNELVPYAVKVKYNRNGHKFKTMQELGAILICEEDRSVC